MVPWFFSLALFAHPIALLSMQMQQYSQNKTSERNLFLTYHKGKLCQAPSRKRRARPRRDVTLPREYESVAETHSVRLVATPFFHIHVNVVRSRE
jgi:hypothetical protein